MRKNLPSYLVLLLLILCGFTSTVNAQCTVNPPSNSPGFYPDPLPSGCVGDMYAEVVQFVFPLDTTVTAPPFGTFTVPFDSFNVDAIVDVPAGLGFTLNNPSGKYYPQSATVSARGCGDVMGVPTTANSANDSVGVVVTAWITAPFVGVQSAQDTLRVPLRIFNTPSASFSSGSAGGNSVNFLGSGGSGVTRLWDFGDGNTSSLQNPTHTYASTGNYVVCYTLTNNGGCADTTCMVVTVGCPAPVTLWNVSGSGLTRNFNDLTISNPITWFWDFGDGFTSTQQNPTHTYSGAGTFTVCLTLMDSCGTDSSCQVVQVCDPIAASFTESASALTVTFTDASTGPVATYSWDFGDGNTSTAQNPTHTYANPGSYTVVQVITNACGDVETSSTIVRVCETLSASFNFTSTSGNGLSYDFSDLTTGQVATWIWDFGDGNTSSFQNPSHTYSASITANVCLIVIDSCGSVDSLCMPVTVVDVNNPGENTFMELFPNPAQQFITLRGVLNNPAAVEVRVSDVMGKSVMHTGWNADTRFVEQKLDVSALPNGMYFVTVQAGAQKYTLRLIIQ